MYAKRLLKTNKRDFCTVDLNEQRELAKTLKISNSNPHNAGRKAQLKDLIRNIAP